MFNQIVGGYTNIDNIDYQKKSQSDQFQSTPTEDTLAPDYKSPETKIKNHTVIINSIDRNWLNVSSNGNVLESPYRFKVKLGGSSKDRYSLVSQNYKNVISFSIDKVILSNRVCNTSYTSNISPRLNDNPYLAVSVAGINFSSYGTNRTLNETLGIYTPLIPLPTTFSDITYLEFKNTSIQRKEYTPAPEGYISLLDISITSPLGITASNLNDVLDIYSIFLSTSNTVPISNSDSLIIQTSTYFNDSEFRRNDLIQIRNYSYHNLSYDESYIFNNWINSTNGHYISNISKSNPSTELYNQIIIPLPASLSRNTGTIDVEPWFASFLIKSFSNVAIQDNGGKCINSNTQSHLVVNIKTLEKNDNIFFKDFD